MSRKKPSAIPARSNPVAKYAHTVNKSLSFRDRTAYTRKNKHKGQEPSPLLQVA